MKLQKTISILLMLCVISFTALAQNVKKVQTYYDPLGRTRIHEVYTTLTTPPYPIHGVYKEWDQSGVLMTEANFQNGKKHGPYKVYFNAGMRDLVGKENIGKLYTVSNYANDKLNGLEQMYNYTLNKPQVVLQKTWLNGKQTKEEEWYEDGKPKSVSTENGLNTEWYPAGGKASEVMMKNGVEEGKMNEWYENGQVAFSAVYKAGKITGDAIAYFENGTKKQVITFDPVTFVDIKTVAYFPDGKIKFEKTFVNQQYDAVVYDSVTGKKTLVQTWVKDPRKDDGTLVLNGVSTEFETDGSVIEQINYEFGTPIGEVKTVDQNGKVVLSGRFEYGNRVGEWLYYLKADGKKTNKSSEAAKFRKADYGPRGGGNCQYVDYYITGEKFEEGKIRGESNIQTRTTYYKNGQVMETGFFGYPTKGDGSWKNGEWKSYYENGQLKTKGSYSGGNETGVWEYYDESGKLVETKQF